jgi:hypothetical protein
MGLIIPSRHGGLEGMKGNSILRIWPSRAYPAMWIVGGSKADCGRTNEGKSDIFCVSVKHHKESLQLPGLLRNQQESISLCQPPKERDTIQTRHEGDLPS